MGRRGLGYGNRLTGWEMGPLCVLASGANKVKLPDIPHDK